VTHPETHSEEVHAHRPNYLLIFVLLFVLTIIEVGITMIGLPQWIVNSALLAFMAFKVLLVALFYMHLRMDSKWFSYLFIIPIPFVVLIMAALYFTNYQIR
jgi:cytochrome c oxidase subunit IV